MKAGVASVLAMRARFVFVIGPLEVIAALEISWVTWISVRLRFPTLPKIIAAQIQTD